MPRPKQVTAIPPRKRKLGYDARVIWILHRHQPLTFIQLVEEFDPMKKNSTEKLAKRYAKEKSLKYDILPFLMDKEILREVRRDKKIFYALSDFTDIEANVRWDTEDFELLHCRMPTLKEIALEVGLDPSKTEDIVYPLAPKTGWKPPTEQDKSFAQTDARRRLELAAWIKLGCAKTEYVRKEWPEEEFEKAERTLKIHPEYVPEIEAYRYRGESDEKFYYGLIWPKVAANITDITNVDTWGKHLQITGDYIVPLKAQMVKTKSFEGCEKAFEMIERNPDDLYSINGPKRDLHIRGIV